MDPTAPGPFAFADAERVRGILSTAGWSDIAISPFNTQVGGGSLDDAQALAFKIGPLGRALRENPDCVDAVSGAVRAALAGYVTDGKVLMPAAVWIVTALAA
jgi:hypothetical protein